MRSYLVVLVLCLLATQIQSQARIGCKGMGGKYVDWFVIITTPQTIHNKEPEAGFLYYDSTMNQDSFIVNPGYGNEAHNPIGLTAAQVAHDELLNAAWNDQLNKEWGLGSDNSKRAHSKGYIGLDKSKRQGFFMDHSVPQYPPIENDNIVPDIADSQRVKAQHHFCLSIKSGQIAEQIYKNICFLNPHMYHHDQAFEQCVKDTTKQKFQYLNFKTTGGEIKAIYKNGWNMIKNHKNQNVPYEVEIFEEGVAPLVKSNIVIQTFPTPPAFPKICTKPYHITNSLLMKAKRETWTQGSDHCKWAYATQTDYACFGDLNRNSYGQKTRGGAFYCIQNRGLRNALRAINPQPETC